MKYNRIVFNEKEINCVTLIQDYFILLGWGVKYAVIDYYPIRSSQISF